MDSLTLISPAKINLCLYVLGRDPNGYHRLLTLFHRISLADKIQLRKKKKGFSFSCTDPHLPVDGRNLVTRAYLLLKENRPSLGGVSIRLHKKIPVGAGLGGGSSNAAHFLLGMNQLYRLGLTQEALLRLGRQLGADVPFFLTRVNQAVGRRWGDEVTPCPIKRRLWFLLLIDRKGINTKKVYQTLPHSLPPVSLTKTNRTVKILLSFLERGKLFEAGRLLQNDLESPATRLRASIQSKINYLRRFGLRAVGMSGSGPTVFAVFCRKSEAEQVAKSLALPHRLGEVVLCHTY